MTRRILFYVQHLLGIGHLRRTAVIARACAERGLAVTVASGGTVVGGIDWGAVTVVQLPALRATDETFTTLVGDDGGPLDAAFEARRCAALLEIFHRVQPDVLVVELFPFGRRRLRFELLPLLEAAGSARPRPWIASSVRDVLTARKPERWAETTGWALRYLDAVLVHGDPQAIPFGVTFPAIEAIAEKVHYTGYVTTPPAAPGGPGSPGWNEVVVSAGGGAVSERLLGAAMAARQHSAAASAVVWRLLAGANLDEAAFAALAARAPDGVLVERARDDFATLLANCAVSVSQAGYNTLAETISAGVRAVVVPFAGGLETEQALRAARFEALGLVRCVTEAALTPERLAGAVDAALAAPKPETAAVAIDGARKSADLIDQWARRNPGRNNV